MDHIESNDRLDWSRVLKPSGQPRMAVGLVLGDIFWRGSPWGSQVRMAAVAGAEVGVGWAGVACRLTV
jgi:hypothetical protein